MIEAILIAMNTVLLLLKTVVIYNLKPIYKDYVKNEVNITELDVQKTELLLLDLKQRLKNPINSIIYD